MMWWHLVAPRDAVHVHREGQGRLPDPERLLLPRVAGDAVLIVERADRDSNICLGRLPLEGKYIHATLPPISLPPGPLIPALPPAHFAPSPGAYTLARPVASPPAPSAPIRGYQPEASYAQGRSTCR